MIEYRRSTARWLDYVACDQDNAELFFPIGNTGPSLLQIEEAKQFCRRSCPAIGYCAIFAIENGTEGVWGGLSEDERKSRSVLRHPLSTAQELDDEIRKRRPDLFEDTILPPLPPLIRIVEIPDPELTTNSNRNSRA
jgi:WhiB family redox-sensing transcriptional regulator